MSAVSDVVEIVGVHGILQGRKNTQSLTSEWSRAVRHGLRAASLDVAPLSLRVPHLSPLLRVPTDLLGPGDEDDLTTLSADEAAFVESGLADLLEGLDGDEVDQLAAEATTLAGLPAFPTRHGLRLLTAVDGRWRGGARPVLAVLREVYAYLHAPSCGQNVRRRVRTTATAHTRLLLAHSLGSVVAYDLLRRGELPQITTLVTFGSPLAWPTVRTALDASCEAELTAPLAVSWTNLHDERDAVTAGRRLSPLWPQVTDLPVQNPRLDAHGAAGYLQQPGMAATIVSGLRR